MFETFNHAPLVNEFMNAARKDFTALLCRGIKDDDRKPTIKLSMRGNTAAVTWQHDYDGKLSLAHLIMPTMPADARLTRREADRLIGYWIHEAGHVIATNRDDWMTATREGIANLVNGIEDPRIEAYMIKRHAGARDVLQSLATHIAGQCRANGWRGDSMRNLPYLLAQMGRMRLWGLQCPHTTSAIAEIPLAWRPVIDDALTALTKAQSTADVLNIAREIMHRLGDPKLPSNDQADTNPGNNDTSNDDTAKGDTSTNDDTSADSDDNDTSANDDTSADSDDNTSSDNDDDNASADSDNNTSENNCATDDDDTSTTDDDASTSSGDNAQGDGVGKMGNQEIPSDTYTDNPEPSIDDIAETVRQRNQTNNDDLDGDAIVNNGHTCHVFRRHNFANLPDSSAEAIYQRVRDHVPTSARLRNDIRRLVRSPDREEIERRRPNGRFDRKMLASAIAGTETVFRRRQEVDGTTAAVSLLIDLSTSMSGNRIQAAASLAVNLTEIIERAGASIEVGGFLPDDHSVYELISKQVPVSGRLKIFKTRSENTRQFATRRQLGMIRYAANGNTRMAPALLEMGNRLRQAKANKRILIVLADGNCDLGDDVVRAATRLLEAYGILVIGVGIFDDMSKMTPRHNLSIYDLYDLANHGLGALLKELRD